MANPVLEDLKRAILEYDSELATAAAKQVVDQNLDPLEAIGVMSAAVKQVGDAFGRGDLWLPDLVGAGEAMSGAMPILEAEIKRQGAKSKSLGSVVIGTVRGDVHSIGKSMVSSLLAAEGFEVHDLGVDVEPQQFVEAVREHEADLLGMSALLTVTAPEQKKVIALLAEKGLRDRLKIIVGGGAISEEFARSVGADGYDSSAPGAVKLARSLLGV